MASTGIVTAEEYFWHDTGSGWILPADGVVLQPFEHPENPETKRRFLNLLSRSELLPRLTAITATPATREQVEAVHDAGYLDSIASQSAAGGGDAGGLTPFGLGSYEIALSSAGGCIAAADAIADGTVSNAYALVRPPGHHAIRDSGMGFCMINNAAVAVKHLQQTGQAPRIAMVDWDVHHGNGQQAIFYDDPSVLTISQHQKLSFPPDSGHMEDIGEGEGTGANINIPLPPGSGHGAFIATFERVVVPALQRFKPDFIVVPSGFDGSIFDPLGRMMGYSNTYRTLTRILKQQASDLCGGRLLMTHEGGYNSAYVPFIGLAVLEELSGITTGMVDPYLFIAEGTGDQELQPHQDVVIAATEQLVANVPTR